MKAHSGSLRLTSTNLRCPAGSSEAAAAATAGALRPVAKSLELQPRYRPPVPVPGALPRHGCCTSSCSISMWPSQTALGPLTGCGVDRVLPVLPDKTCRCPKCKRLASQIQSCCGIGSLPVYSNHCYPPGLCLLIDKPGVGPIKVLSLGCT